MIFGRKFRDALKSFLPVQIFIAYCFIVSGLIVNFAQLLSCILVWPFSKTLYRRINYHLGALLWSREYYKLIFIDTKFYGFCLELTFLYSWWSDSNVTVYANPQDLKDLEHEYSIILVNHRYEIDWLVGLVVAQEIGLLGVCSYCKY